MRKIIIASMLVLASSNVFAQEATTPETVSAPVEVENTVPEALIVNFKNVCNSRAVKSKKLTSACETATLPKPLKSGKAFRASGIGAEVNTLIANYEFIK